MNVILYLLVKMHLLDILQFNFRAGGAYTNNQTFPEQLSVPAAHTDPGSFSL